MAKVAKPASVAVLSPSRSLNASCPEAPPRCVRICEHAANRTLPPFARNKIDLQQAYFQVNEVHALGFARQP